MPLKGGSPLPLDKRAAILYKFLPAHHKARARLFPMGPQQARRTPVSCGFSCLIYCLTSFKRNLFFPLKIDISVLQSNILIELHLPVYISAVIIS